MSEFQKEFTDLLRRINLSDAEAAMLLYTLEQARATPGASLAAALTGWFEDLCASRAERAGAGG